LERPGLLEFVVYALVLSVAAVWVYALPPFTRDPSVQVADVQPTSSISSAEPENGQSETPTEAASSDSAAADEPPARSARRRRPSPASSPAATRSAPFWW
jgi:cytoskeletal protein RodZ